MRIIGIDLSKYVLRRWNYRIFLNGQHTMNATQFEQQNAKETRIIRFYEVLHTQKRLIKFTIHASNHNQT